MGCDNIICWLLTQVLWSNLSESCSHLSEKMNKNPWTKHCIPQPRELSHISCVEWLTSHWEKRVVRANQCQRRPAVASVKGWGPMIGKWHIAIPRTQLSVCIYVYVCVCVWVFVSMSVCECVWVCVHASVCVHVCVYVWVCEYAGQELLTTNAVSGEKNKINPFLAEHTVHLAGLPRSVLLIGSWWLLWCSLPQPLSPSLTPLDRAP